MEHFYSTTAFAAALVCLLTSMLLFFRYKEGDTSRIILASIILFSVPGYLHCFINSFDRIPSTTPISVPFLLIAIFIVTCYILYPLEVISPGWINYKNLLKLFSPVFLFTSYWLLSLAAGVEYTPYSSFLQMIPHLDQFNVQFRLFLGLMIFSPFLFVFSVKSRGRFNNADPSWRRKYSAMFIINSMAYLMVLVFNSIYIDTFYYYISVGCSLYIAYLELFERIIKKTKIEDFPADVNDEIESVETEHRDKNIYTLFERLDYYMRDSMAWRDPDLSMTAIVVLLHTNRTTLSRAVQEQGYASYTHYVNTLRVNDFMQSVEKGTTDSFQDLFFDAGFRSRATALRNFRIVTGTTPSYYYRKKDE